MLKYQADGASAWPSFNPWKWNPWKRNLWKWNPWKRNLWKWNPWKRNLWKVSVGANRHHVGSEWLEQLSATGRRRILTRHVLTGLGIPPAIRRLIVHIGTF